MNEKAFTKFSKIVLINVFLVILAGGIVRMTQSGMGCPDWPRCFGRWIPPTDESQLPANYKQIYAFKYVDTSFNVYHTWVEYFNRLVGMLLGILLLIQFVWVARYWKSKKSIVLLCGANLLLTGFQGYLGSKVVEANLEVVKITVHMLVALVIAALSLKVINQMNHDKEKVANKNLKAISFITIILLLIQIVMGTQVRQQIDDISKSFDFMHRDQWVQHLNGVFNFHRIFSILIGVACVYLYMMYKDVKKLRLSCQLMIVTVIGNIVLGLIMASMNMPAFAQPSHLVFSSILLMTVYYNWLNTKREVGS